MYAENCKDQTNTPGIAATYLDLHFFFEMGNIWIKTHGIFLTKRTGKTPCVIVVFDQKMFVETIGLCHSSHLPGLGSCFGENVDEKNRTYVF